MACACGCSQQQFGLACGASCAGGCAGGCGCSGKAARPRLVRLVRLPLVPLGELRGVIYRPNRSFNGAGEAPKNYVHFFQRPPVLAADPTGRRLYIIGGRYRLTHRGIEG